MAKKEQKKVGDIPVEEKLIALYRLQTVDSKIHDIQILRGEQPLIVRDLEDEITGLKTRISKLEGEITEFEVAVLNRKNQIKDAESQIKVYEEQQKKVRNNREFDSLMKELEYQKLDIQLSEKRIREYTSKIKSKQQIITEAQKNLKEREIDYEQNSNELENIISETQKDEELLAQQADTIKTMIEPRLLTAYERIKKNTRNGLGVVTIVREACGGCFNKIPPQRQLDIKSHKKVIVCEHCGRILVDEDIKDLL